MTLISTVSASDNKSSIVNNHLPRQTLSVTAKYKPLTLAFHLSLLNFELELDKMLCNFCFRIRGKSIFCVLISISLNQSQAFGCVANTVSRAGGKEAACLDRTMITLRTSGHLNKSVEDNESQGF